MTEFKVGNKWVGDNHPTYFIADISANHDGEFDKALKLIRMAADAGADVAKFQHFRADHIVSKQGFEKLGKLAHQAGWKEDVYEAFKRLAIPWEWTDKLAYACKAYGIEFMSTPYDMEAVNHLEPYVNAYKIGSGDITYIQLIRHIVSKSKPVLLATGASDFWDVHRAMEMVGAAPVCLMQCNTNYTGNDDNNEQYLNLRVIHDYKYAYPDAVMGLSDHTTNVAPILGAVTLGARVIERHFTDSPTQVGPDHGFSLDPVEWQQMVYEVRSLEKALGNGRKVIQPNEAETVVLQRRCLRAARDLGAGEVIAPADIAVLRPAPLGSMAPRLFDKVVGRTVVRPMKEGEEYYDDSFL
jgi:sialic acid synthase SpsE